MTRERIDALENDKRELKEEVKRLQGQVDRLGPENSGLVVELRNAEANSVVATVLMGGGGFLVSYAGFTGQAASLWANVAAGFLLAGIVLMLWQSIRRRRDVPTDGKGSAKEQP